MSAGTFKSRQSDQHLLYYTCCINKLASVAEETGLGLIWSQAARQVFYSDVNRTKIVIAVKPVLISGHSKIDKTKDLSLMKVESIAECSLGAFCNTFDLH